MTDPGLNSNASNATTTDSNPAESNPVTQQSIQTNEDMAPMDNLEPEQEEVFDPQSIVRDIVEDDRNGQNLRLHDLYEQQKQNLVGTVVNTSASLSWKVRNDIL